MKYSQYIVINFLMFSLISSMEITKNKVALISVSNKAKSAELVQALIHHGYIILSTGGTFAHLKEKLLPEEAVYLKEVSDITKFPEILGGRVKTLHPIIAGGILADTSKSEHTNDLTKHDINPIDIVVVNLYPFEKVTAGKDVAQEVAIENIDIGGPTLLRSAAKNFKRVTVITDINDYDTLIKNPETSEEYRKLLAAKAFRHVTCYDAAISNYFSGGDQIIRIYNRMLPLKYGLNPHQKEAGLYSINNEAFPFTVLNGDPGYINILDALHAWPLVHEVEELFHIPCAASFKHTSPAGVALGIQLTSEEETMYGINSGEISPLGCAFIRARNVDPKSSFGDFIALSREVDEPTARLIGSEVSDGIIAPHYTPGALRVLQKKKEGKYVILQADNACQNTQKQQIKEINGCALIQEPNAAYTNQNYLSHVVTIKKDIPCHKACDLLLANIALKYTQSNSIAYAKEGQVIGIGAGQQNRVDCVKLAGKKVALWHLRRHPKMLALWNFFKPSIKRQEKINAIVDILENDHYDPNLFFQEPPLLSAGEKENWLRKLQGVCLASDAFFPFSDNIDVAWKFGVNYILQPGGSKADEAVIQACNEHGIVMAHSGVRMFTH